MNATAKSFELIYGDGYLGVQGADFSYLFSYEKAGPTSFFAQGKEWLYRPPVPTFWRALTDNDRGSNFHQRSKYWVAEDVFANCIKRTVVVDDQAEELFLAPANNQFGGSRKAAKVAITYHYQIAAFADVDVKITYEVQANGEILVTPSYQGAVGVPELPVFGVRFVLPTPADEYTYQGLSGETYPDRMAGGKPGVYTQQGLPVTPYMVPQDSMMHMETHWVTVKRTKVLDNRGSSGASVVRVTKASAPFAFSCVPYTALEIEQATHQEELPPVRRTVLSIYAAVRGVGGIDSWGSDVEAPVRLLGEANYQTSVRLTFETVD